MSLGDATDLWIHNRNDFSIGGGDRVDTISWGYIKRTTDLGLTWVVDSLNFQTNGLTYIDSSRGFANSGPWFYQTKNGGTKWEKDTLVNSLLSEKNLGIWKFYFTSFTNGFLEVYTKNYWYPKISLFRTLNSGETWTSLFDYTPDSVNGGYYFIDILNGFTKLRNNQFCKTTDGGYTWDCIPLNIVTGVEDYNNQPADYYLLQNYPNPFNPSTNIKFSLPEGSVTTIKVYDILGEEKATLLNEYKSAGSYTATFDCKNLPSGVYIYTITSGSFKQSRKMLLMK
ncbi:MAG TPA: T9SS type A sorting domain-containing protein [Ignavibacteriaceae bacterium]|nr:T9SS type A sorting domain-containing protein [Ignavibacteriaceae bacterium]